TSSDIYNARAQLRQQNLAGRTPIQALVDELQEGNFLYEYKCDNAGSVTHLFFAHNESISLTRQYSTVILMDCTYKTNRFKMPLLNIVGEEEKDYKWALTQFIRIFDGVQKPGVIVTDRELALMNALRLIFPNSKNLLCVWHISKNVLKNCKPQFLKETENKESSEWESFLTKWNEIVQSELESEFDIKWRDF
ncbi:6295_t:CDS:2, partial [Racocetra persica]